MKPLKKIHHVITITICIASASIVHAQTTIYKWVDKNGVVSFSQYPPGDQHQGEVTTMTVQSMPETQQRAAKRMINTLKQAESANEQENIQQADQSVESALKQLEIAEHNLSVGSVPAGEDRVGNVGGHARLRDTYFERVTQLQNEVDKARKALTDAYNSRDQGGPD